MSTAPDAGSLPAGLANGLEALGLTLSAVQQTQLLAYLALLSRWSKVYNLTAVREPEAMLSHHVLDCLAIVRPLCATLDQRWPLWRESQESTRLRLLDVGAGAGLPGVVLAVACPWLRVDCVDAVAKKAAFVQQVAAQLKLPNLRGLHARCETLPAQYQVVTSRAFAALADFVTWTDQALLEGGIWLAMKGQHPAQELSALPKTVTVFHVEPIDVPGLDADRCLVWMQRAAEAVL